MMKKLLLIVLLGSGMLSFAQGVAYTGTPIALTRGGFPAAGATVTVCSGNVTVTLTASPPCSPYASIYSDPALSVPITQPGFHTDGLGNYPFFVTAASTYTVVITGSGLTGYFSVWNSPVTSKAVIDVRDISGVDCTGATDSSTALNLWTDGTTHPEVDGRTIELESCIAQGGIRLDHIWWVQKFSHGVTLHLGPKYGSGGHSLFACSVDSAPTGLDHVPVILFERIFKPSIIGGMIESFGGTSGSKCGGGGTSTANAGVSVQNDFTTYSGGVTTTQGRFEDTYYLPGSGGAIANWQGIVIGGSSVTSQNLEGMRIIGNWIHGQNSSNSIGVNIAGSNSDHGIAQLNTFNDIKYAFKTVGPEWTIDSNVTSGVGDFAVFGGGAFIQDIQGSFLLISNNEHAERGGQFFNTNGGAGPEGIIFLNNKIGGTDSGALQAGLSNIDCGQCVGHYTFIGNNGSNVGGAPVITYTVNNGSGALFHDYGNRWQSAPFTIDVTKAAAYEGLDRRNVTNLKLQTIPLAPITLGFDSASPGTPAVDFQNVKQNGTGPSRYLMRGMSSAGTTDSLVISNVTTQGTPSFTVGPKLAGGLVTQAAATVVINSVTNIGTPGSTTWGYKLFSYTSGGLGNVSAEVTTATGNATLTSSNYNRIRSTTIGPEFWKTCLYRTTGAPTGFIGAVNNNLAPIFVAGSADGFGGDNGLYIADTGQAVDASGTICPAAVPTSTANGSANIPTGATYQINSTQISAANLSNGTTGTAGTAVVLATSPALVTPNIGVATATSLTLASLLVSSTAPTISTHFNTSGDSISANNGAAAFEVTVGSGAAGSTGAVTLPAAATSWHCNTRNLNRGAYIQQTGARSTTIATFTNYGTTVGTPVNWTNGDVLSIGCVAY